MEMKIYNVALIGCGHMGQVHLDHIYYKKNVNITCVCDIHEETALSVQKKYAAARVETDAEKCIASDDVDIVIIATYPSTHLELLKLCIKHKKHVICEKPITSDLESGKEFCNIVKSNPNIKILIGHILRHNKTYQKVGEMIRSGAIGFPVAMRMTQNHHTMLWKRYKTLIDETSPIIDCGVHYLDVAQWFTGEKIIGIDGFGTITEPDLKPGQYNYGMIHARLSGGSTAFYEAGWGNTIASNNTKEFIGPKGRIKLVFQKDRASHQEEGDLIEYYKYPENEYITINLPSERQPTDVQFDYLVSMIESNLPPVPTIDEVYESFRLTHEADKQIQKYIAEHPPVIKL